MWRGRGGDLCAARGSRAEGARRGGSGGGFGGFGGLEVVSVSFEDHKIIRR